MLYSLFAAQLGGRVDNLAIEGQGLESYWFELNIAQWLDIVGRTAPAIEVNLTGCSRNVLFYSVKRIPTFGKTVDCIEFENEPIRSGPIVALKARLIAK